MRSSTALRILLVSLLFVSCDNTPEKQPEVLNIAVPYDPDTLDPHAKDLVGHFAVASNFYEPLVRLDARMRLMPCLAISWENPDALTWIFHLRPSVEFHSGKVMTSRDVVFSLERLLRNELLEMRAYLSGVAEVSTLDASTVRIQTTHPLHLLPNKLSFVHIVPEGSSDEMLAGKADGTAPYSLIGWERNKLVRMQRFPDHWSGAVVLPFANLHLNTSAEQAMKSLPERKFQLVRFDSKQSEPLIKGEVDYEILRNDTLFVSYLGFDLSRHVTPQCSAVPNPFKSLAVRRAIHLAMDRDKLVKNLAVFASPATQPLPPFVFGYNPAIGLPKHDVTEARKLLTETGYGNGFDVTLDTSRGMEPAAKLAAEQLREIGIRATVKAMPTSEYYRTLDSGDSSLFLSSYGCVTGDASDYLDDALHSRDSSRRYGGSNFGRYFNPQIDRLIEQSAVIQKVENRRIRLQEIQSLTMQDLPWIPLFIDQEVYAIDTRFSWQPRSDGFIIAYEVILRSPDS